ncbi:HNH endonuclease [Mechercharimyces sp. CAU 1602]|uniref:HNH endonuclease n=1 Tax=Mechercharimyces sp. CAU 1602 TaxID=2973933 RepID=UPI00216116E4|nr:HNH endonuclease [Mechercharimyces sp. CAU 1602]MCS1351678.1 HNH endonuclease [Mechercharimyces sp. CAU 1602]
MYLVRKSTPVKKGDINVFNHHHQELGKIGLVPSETHGPTKHTGGRAIWGGGQKYR